MKKWIAVYGHPLCGNLSALLHIYNAQKKMWFFLYERFQRK